MLHELVVSDELNIDDRLPLDESTRGNKLLSLSFCFLLLLPCLDGIAAKFLLSFDFRPPFLLTGLGESLTKKRIYSDISIESTRFGFDMCPLFVITLHKEACMLLLVIQSLIEQGKPVNSESKSRFEKKKIASLV